MLLKNIYNNNNNNNNITEEKALIEMLKLVKKYHLEKPEAKTQNKKAQVNKALLVLVLEKI